MRSLVRTIAPRLHQQISDFLFLRTLREYRTRLGWRLGPRYAKYLERCRSAHPNLEPLGPTLAKIAEQYIEHGHVSFHNEKLEKAAETIFARLKLLENKDGQIWINKHGDHQGAHRPYNGNVWLDFPETETIVSALDPVFKGIYGAYYKIFYTTIEKCVGVEQAPTGSQIWHGDGGPGTCINVAVYLHPTDSGSGCLQTLDWNASFQIYAKERSEFDSFLAEYCVKHDLNVESLDNIARREIRASYYGQAIDAMFSKRITCTTGPTGSTVLFQNNNLHRGGYPALGQERYALFMHIYPSETPAPIDKYLQEGAVKTTGYPIDPAF